MTDVFDFTALYIKVLLPLALPLEYTYRVPQELNEEIAIGKRVVVQFGKKKIYTGLIYEISEQPPSGYQAKYILSILDNTPVTTEKELTFWKWISTYYMCTLGEVMQAALPAAMKLESQSKIVLNSGAELNMELYDMGEVAVLYQLQKANSLTLDEIDVLTKSKGNYKYVQSLYERGLVSIEEGVVQKYKPKLITYILFSDNYSSEESRLELFNKLENSAALQLHVVMQLMSSDPQNLSVEKNAFINEKKLSPSSVKTLLKNGVLIEYTQQVDRVVYEGNAEFPINVLTPDQQAAFEQITTAFNTYQTVLMQGVTSSGKTHVYIQLIEEAIKDDGQVLYLLPEISLTTQLIRRIQTYFGAKVLVHHSKFSNNEQQEIWTKIRNGEGQILIAPRSGIFMPFNRLSLVIVDEEHENTYKQSEPSPRYHARDSAIVLANVHNAKVLLGSATPSLETMLNATNKKYGYVQLNQRYSGVELPQFELVDMTVERKQKTNNGLFSSVLLNRIEETLKAKQQVVIFQNRKGYVPITECSDCSWSPRCIRCDITLTYYRSENRLRCHLCGYNTPPVSKCPACGNSALKMMGYGTERIESELQLLFPEAIIARLDYESTRTKTAFQNIISSFENKETDILVGTQMLAKGLDFEHLSLVGIVDADHALNFPDFRAYERSFQLFTQVSGRAGRRDKPGLVVIQTNQPHHRVIKDVIEHNYQHFYDTEIFERQQFNYPPFIRLIQITLKHREKGILDQAAAQLATMLGMSLKEAILGPQEPHVSRVRNLYLQHLLIKVLPPLKLQSVKKLIQSCKDQIKGTKQFNQVRINIDVDPN